jgi:hypothetical protein
LEEFGIKWGRVEEAFEEGRGPCRLVKAVMMMMMMMMLLLSTCETYSPVKRSVFK